MIIEKIKKIGKIVFITILLLCIIFGAIYYGDFFKKVYLAIASLFIAILAALPFFSPSAKDHSETIKELEQEKKELEKERELIQKQTEEEAYNSLPDETKKKIDDIRNTVVSSTIEKIKARNKN